MAVDCSHPQDWRGYGVLVAVSGALHVTEFCFACHRRTTGAFVGKEDAQRLGLDIETLDVVQDNRSPDYPCERCGDIETELHHWAPSYLFDDADSWPTGHLCRTCHTRWHTLVTPEMCKKATI